MPLHAQRSQDVATCRPATRRHSHRRSDAVERLVLVVLVIQQQQAGCFGSFPVGCRLIAGRDGAHHASSCVSAGSTVSLSHQRGTHLTRKRVFITPGMGAPWSTVTCAAAGLGCLPVRPPSLPPGVGGSVELRGWGQIWRRSAVIVAGGQEHSGGERLAGIGFIDPGKVCQKNADGEPLLRGLAISIAGRPALSPTADPGRCWCCWRPSGCHCRSCSRHQPSRST